MLFTTFLVVSYIVIMWHILNKLFNPGEEMMELHSMFLFLVKVFFGILVIAFLAKHIAKATA